MAQTIVVAEGLEKSFGSKPAVRGVSFEICRGDIYGFIGKNGAGKTTVMRMLCGLMRPSNGNVRIFRCESASAQGGVSVRIGYLPQNIRFDDNRSVGEIIGFFSRLRQAGNGRPMLDVREMGLDIALKAKHLSPGQQRKLQLAVATIGNPELLVFDEPTAGLDPMGVQQVREIIRDLNSRGSTVFISSHVLQELDNLCGKVAVIDQGRLLFQGPCLSTYELEVDSDAKSACGSLGVMFCGRCTAGDGKIYARIEREEVPPLLGALYEHGVQVYSVKRMGLELFYNSLMKEGA